MSAVLEVENIRKAFGGLVAVNEISFSVSPGEIFGLIGPNGSGKTTTLNLIAGSFSTDSGKIYLDGTDVTSYPNARRVRAHINRTFQLVRTLPSMTVHDNVRIGALYGADSLSFTEADRKTEELLTLVGIADKARLVGSQLTYIDQKRAELARACATNPRLLLLDEWFAGLNPTELNGGIELVRKLSASGISIVLVEHVIAAVRALCKRSLIMNAGRFVTMGETNAVLSDPIVKDVYLGRAHD